MYVCMYVYVYIYIYLPDDDGQVARAGVVGGARDADALAGGAVEGGPAAASLVDAGVLVRVRRADGAAALVAGDGGRQVGVPREVVARARGSVDGVARVARHLPA